jgi:RNA-directed DNA polymerase
MWLPMHDRSGKPGLKPAPERLAEQRELIRSLVGLLPAHPAAHGYVKGRSPWTCLAPHVGCRWLMHLDLCWAFENTTAFNVRLNLQSLGLSDSQIDYICSLCMTGAIGLPRGAPTSPSLFNVSMWMLDDVLVRFGDCYTRYSDNLILSGEGLFFEGAVRKCVRHYGYEINERKSRLMIRGRTPMEALGITVGENALSSPRRERKKERAKLHNLGGQS